MIRSSELGFGRRRLAAFFCFMSVPVFCQDPGALAIRNITVIDVEGGRAVPAQTVVIQGARIASAGSTTSVKLPTGVRTVDGTGKFLIPGLWDMHTHGYGAGTFMLHVANGVTGMRVMGTSIENARELKAGTGRGGLPARVGNRIAAVTGPTLDAFPENFDQFVVKTPEEARQAVDRLHQAGLDFVKIHTQMDRSTWQAAIDRARELKMLVAGHVPWPISAAEASDAGYRSIEHLNGVLFSCSSQEEALRHDAAAGMPGPQGTTVRVRLRLADRLLSTFDSAKCEALARRFARNGTWHVPTLITNKYVAMGIGFDRAEDNPLTRHLPAWLVKWWLAGKASRDKREKGRTYPELFDRWLQVTAMLHRAGVKLMAGTDSGGPGLVFGFSMHDELALLVRAGLSPAEALRSATLNPAEFAGKSSDFGSVKPGKFADLVLLRSNPLENIEHTKTIDAVSYDGRLYDRAALDRMLDEQEAMVRKLDFSAPEK